jgi:deoxyhypusine synthase
MGYKESYMPEPLDEGKKKKKKEILNTRISPVDFEKINDVGDLVESFQSASIQARNLGQCAKIFGKMLQDEEKPTIILGLAGPLIAAGLRKIIRDMVHYNMVDVIVSTGAILYQDYYNALGGGHYYGSPNADDTQLRDLFINRIYDTYVDDELFVEDDTLVGRFADTLEPEKIMCLYSVRLSTTPVWG